MRVKNGWILSDYTAGCLREHFDGTQEELNIYVLLHGLRWETTEKVIISRDLYCNKYDAMLGDYRLYPDENGIVATKKE